MNTSFTNIQRIAAGVVLLMASLLLAGAVSRAINQKEGDEITLVCEEKLANIAGNPLTTITVNYLPGRKPVVRVHAGSIFVYVLSSAIRSENSATESVKIYKTGESFFEPSGRKHLLSENASDTEPVSLLTVFAADDAAKLTTFDVALSASSADQNSLTKSSTLLL